jgi:hypothetical protein
MEMSVDVWASSASGLPKGHSGTSLPWNQRLEQRAAALTSKLDRPAAGPHNDRKDTDTKDTQ